MINFAYAPVLLLLLLLPLLLWLRSRQGKPAAVRYSSLKLITSGSHPVKSRKGSLNWLFLILPWILVVLALARPRITDIEETTDSSGVDIMLAIDVSGSMHAMDFFIDGQRDTRLEAVKTVVAGFIKDREFDRIGMVAFAEAPYLVSPLTLNHDWLNKNFARLEVGLIPQGGTAIGSALGMCVNRLREMESESRIVILLSDGDNNRGTLSPEAAAEAAAAYGIRVYTIAAGTEEAAPSPQTDSRGRIYRDANGRPIPSIRRGPTPVNESTLRTIAEVSDGLFFRASDTEGLEEIYAEIDELEKTEITLESYAKHDELFAYPLFAALGILLLGELLRNTRSRRIP